MDPVEEFLKFNNMEFHRVDELEEPPLRGYEESVLERMKRLAAAIKSTSANSDPEHQKSIDWSLLCHWTSQYTRDETCPPDLVDRMYRKKTAHEKVKLIFEVTELSKKICYHAQRVVVENYNRGRKDSTKARQFLKKGLEDLAAKNFDSALVNFNKGIVCAPHPRNTEEPALRNLYAMLIMNRSRTFKCMERYEDSWEDFHEACMLNTSTRFIETLVTTQIELCRSIQENKYVPKKGAELPIDLDSFDFKPKDQSPTLAGALKPLRLEYKREKGRSIVTTEAMEQTGMVIAEEAYVAWLAPPFYDKYCYHCLRPLRDRPTPCPLCVYVRYCSSKCQSKSWRSYHSMECKFMSYLKYLNLGQLALRVVFMNKVEPSLEAYRRYASLRPSQRENKTTFTKSLGDILTLGTHENHRDNLLTHAMFAAAFLTHLASSMAMILDEDMIDFGGLMFKLLAVLKINVSSIGDDLITVSEKDYYFVIEKKLAIGAGLFPTYALINHACVPNCVSAFIGTKIMVTATKAIKPGEEITITYLPENDSKKYEFRHKALIDRWHFSCTCHHCRLQLDL